VAHRNAPLTELGRLRLARAIVEQGWPAARAAERFQVSRPTTHRWATRYRDQGPAGMADRSSRPHHRPHRTPTPVVRKIVHLGWTQRLGPAQIAPRSAWLPRACMPSWSAVGSAAWGPGPGHRPAGPPLRTRHPGDLVHIDVKKLGNIPAGVATGSWAGLPAAATARPTAPAATTAATPTPCTAMGSSTPRSMTTPGWPMPRSTPTRLVRPRPSSCSGPRPGSPTAGWSSSGA
jgi:hypothetical protein